MGSKQLSLNYYRKNRDKINEKRRLLYVSDPKVKELALIRKERFYQVHGGSAYVYDYRKYRKWKINNPEKYQEMIERKREKRRLRYKHDPIYREKEKMRLGLLNKKKYDNGNTRSKIEKDIIDKVIAESKNKCNFCGNTEDLSIDHIIPIKFCGTNEKENLQILCLRCNKSKGFRMISFPFGTKTPTS